MITQGRLQYVRLHQVAGHKIEFIIQWLMAIGPIHNGKINVTMMIKRFWILSIKGMLSL